MDIFVFLLCFTGVFVDVFGVEPSFDVPVINVTVQEGDVAVLPCSVDYLGEHKVVWTDQWSTLLTLDDRRIIDDPRISIERPYTKDWNLHIRKAVYKDRGQYTCQINTNPVKTKTVMLIVLVPSKIINELSSRDQTVREGETVTLVCNVTGVPTPDVTWYKLPNEGIKTKERIGSTGELLIIHNVSRHCDGTYECVAYNNVDPAVTRQIKVFVEFAPEVSLPIKRMGQFLGKEAILDCEVTAYPHEVMYWLKENSPLNLQKKDKYLVEFYSGHEESTLKTLRLRVKNTSQKDYGEYTCCAKNMIGNDKESMILYDYSTILKKKSITTTPSIIEPTPKISNSPTMQGSLTNSGNPGYWTERPGWQDEKKNHKNNPGKERAALESKNMAAHDHVTFTSVLYAMSLTISTLIQSWRS